MKEEVRLAPVKYDLAIATISKMSKEAGKLKIDGIKDTAGYKIVHEKRMEAKCLRVSVEKRRKEYKSEILEYGRNVDSKANELKGLLSEIEESLQIKQSEVDQEKEKIKEEEARKKQEFIQDRIAQLANYTDATAAFDIGTMCDYDFQIILSSAKKTYEDKQTELARIEDEKKAEADRVEAERVAEAERLETQRLAQEEIANEQRIEREKLLAEALKIREEQEKVAEDQRKANEDIIRESRRLSEEKQAIEDAKQKVIDDESRAKELEAAKVEAVKQAKLEAEAKVKKDEEAKLKKAARQPDKVKLLSYSGYLKMRPLSELKSDEAKEIEKVAREKVDHVISFIISETEKL